MGHKQGAHLIILLHGINKTNSSLKNLEKFLISHSFEVLNISYPSTKYSIEELVDNIHKFIATELVKYNKISFIGFSMGGLVIRAYLNKYKLKNLQKVVMVGTPNNGSEVADFFKNNIFYKKLLGPAGGQLTTNQAKHDILFGKTYYKCGIIAGNLPIDFCYPLMRKNPSDGKVSVNSTKLQNMKDHITLKVSHWYMTKSKKVWEQILYFLQYSKFLRK